MVCVLDMEIVIQIHVYRDFHHTTEFIPELAKYTGMDCHFYSTYISFIKKYDDPGLTNTYDNIRFYKKQLVITCGDTDGKFNISNFLSHAIILP